MTMPKLQVRRVASRLPGVSLAAAALFSPWQYAVAQITVAGPMNFDLMSSHLQAVQMQSSIISTSRILQQQNDYHKSTLRPSRALPPRAGAGYATAPPPVTSSAPPPVSNVQAVRAQMHQLYATGSAQPPADSHHRQLVAEALMYETCLAIGTRESGNAQAIRNLADTSQRKLARSGFDMRHLALTDAGLIANSR